MKKTIAMILLMLLTSVWSIVCAGLQDKQSLVVVSSTEVSLCTPTLLPIADYEFEFPRTDTTTNLLLEYFDMLQCTTQQTNLLILPSFIAAEPTYDTICSGETYTWEGEQFIESGSYTKTLQNIYGCDSIVTLHLHVNPTYEVHDTIVACDSYLYNPFSKNGGITLCESGTYKDKTTSISGCDSVFVLHLTINHSEVGTTEYATICHGETYTWNGNVYDTSDTYTLTLSNQQGCDSTATLVLTVLPKSVTQTENAIIGSDKLPYLWRGQSLYATGQYTDTLYYAAAHCDSVIHVLNLTVLATGATDEQTATICDTELPYQWYNQEYTATGQYTYTEKYAGTDIDSIQHILQLTVNPTIRIDETITACDSYTWNGQTYTTSGDYQYTTTAANGCDSITTLHLTINKTVYEQETVTACDSYTWNGQTYTTSGDYQYTTTAANGCDRITTLHLTINYRDTAFFTQTACDSFTWHDQVYNTSGTYYYNTQTVLGCDSVEVLNLTINYSDTAFFTETACDSYTWHDQVYNTSGTYYYNTKTVLGCDSVEVLNLTINYRDTAFFTQTACDSYTWHNQVYNTSGTYYYNTKTVLDCDSVEVLNLTINYRDTAFFTQTACDSFTWHDQVYNTSGTYYYNTQTVLGCDSVEVLNLTINYRDTAFFTKTACDSYEWHGEEYTESGTYYYNTQTMLGCDSVEVLNLTINYRDTAFFTKTACDSYEWHGEEYTESGTYYYNTQTIHGCDSVEVMRLTILPPTKYFATDTALCYGEVCDWRGVTYKESGIYHDTIRNILHCDSLIYTLNLVIYPEIPITHIIDTIAGAEYHWNDQIYTHGGDYTVTLPAITSCDSVVILHLVDNHAAIDTVIVYEQCAGSGEQEVEILTQGYIEQIVLNYSPQAQAAGLRDTVMMLSSTDDIYTIYYDDVRAGVHEVRAVGLFHGKEVASYPFTLTYLYPNTIFEQRYNDLIAVLTHDYNGGYDFTAFQWYKDGVLLPGETHSYLNQSLSFENEYSVLLTNTDGLQLMSCPIIAEDKAELSVYPTILKHGEMVKCHMTDENMLFIHNSTGKIIQEQPLKEGTTAITLPAISGVYLLRFVSNDHIERTFKVIVQ